MSNNNNNNTKPLTHTIIVLPDGETWNTISGCSMVVISDADFNKLCNDEIDAGDIEPIAEVGLNCIA
jgi:hypothetical protein